jgi:microcystin-dependent protein
MSGTIPLSMTQQMDQYGDPLSGGKLYFFVAATVSTPQNAFQDSALSLPWPNPITLDATGRVPQLFLADGLIKIRLTDVHGVTQLVADNLQVIGPSSGGGGGGATVDPTTIYQTGDLKPRYGTGAHTGWVRLNGNTIGSASSGASERANADTQALFQYLWGVDANLVVSGGRGASALADWTGNKQIALPDWRGYGIAGLDDMGAVAAGRLTASYFGTAATVLGAVGGLESNTLTAAAMPVHNHTAASTDSGHQHSYTYYTPVQTGVAGSANAMVGGAVGNTTGIASAVITTTIGNAGSGAAHNNVQPTKLTTIYIKL